MPVRTVQTFHGPVEERQYRATTRSRTMYGSEFTLWARDLDDAIRKVSDMTQLCRSYFSITPIPE